MNCFILEISTNCGPCLDGSYCQCQLTLYFKSHSVSCLAPVRCVIPTGHWVRYHTWEGFHFRFYNFWQILVIFWSVKRQHLYKRGWLRGECIKPWCNGYISGILMLYRIDFQNKMKFSVAEIWEKSTFSSHVKKKYSCHFTITSVVHTYSSTFIWVFDPWMRTWAKFSK